MLTISPTAHGALESASWPAFLTSLREELAETYPHFLPRFPDQVRDRIVDNMVARARRWGVDRQNSIYCFCAWMIEIAANFDEEPEIEAAMRQLGPSLNGRIFELPDLISAEAWDRAERAASNLPFFCDNQDGGKDSDAPTREALAVVLFDAPAGANFEQILTRARELVQQFAPSLVTDALLVTATCVNFFGPDFDKQQWFAQARGSFSSAALVEAMRLRLALNFGRFV